MSDQHTTLVLRRKSDSQDVVGGRNDETRPSYRIGSHATNQDQGANIPSKPVQTATTGLDPGHEEVVSNFLHKPKKQKKMVGDRISKSKPDRRASHSSVASVNETSTRDQKQHYTKLRDPDPNKSPVDTMRIGAMQSSCVKLPGEPGYGYLANGKRIGSAYFGVNSGCLASTNCGSAYATLSTIGEPSRALAEIEQAGWGPKEEIAQQVMRIGKGGQLNVVNAKRYLKKRESAALRQILKYNSELEL